MRMHLAVLLPLTLACAPLRAQQGAAAVAPAVVVPPQIVTSAQGEVRVTPDRALVELSVHTRAATAAAAAAENAQKQRAVLEALRRVGIPNELISTTNYSIYPDQRFDEKTQEQRITGYNVTNTVRVEVRRLEQVGAVIDAALEAGANMVSSLSFYTENTDEPRRAAMAQAVAKARADAEALARAAGGALGELLELSTADVGFPRPMPMVGMMRSEAAQTPITPGQQSVMVNVTGRWRYVGGAR